MATSFFTSAIITTTTTNAAPASASAACTPSFGKRWRSAKGTDSRYCQIVDAHYFRGRLRAADADDRDLLFRERVFDDVLMREGVTTHYLPLSRDGEKGHRCLAGTGSV